MRKIIVNSKNNGKKLNIVLFNFFPSLNSSTFFKALRQKDIKVNGKRVKENISVYENDEIEIYILDDFLFKNNIDLKVVYEDENILVVDKPSDICVIRRRRNKS